MTDSANLLIRQAHLIDPATQREADVDVLIEQGRISQIGEQINATATTVEAQGLWLLPGLVDIGMPALTGRQIARETQAAASGGISQQVMLPGHNCLLDNTAQLRLLQGTVKHQGSTQLLPIGALTQQLAGEQIADLHTLSQAGVIAFSNAGNPVANNTVLKRCLEYAATFDLRVSFCPQDPALSEGGCAHRGAVAARLGLPGIATSAETLAVARALLLAQESGVAIHLHHLSSARSLTLIQTARDAGINVTCDVTINQLLADENALAHFDNNFHLLPPLRRRQDREALLAAVADGRINAICSQHTPLDATQKQHPFASSAPGISGAETLLPLVLKLIDEQLLPRDRALAAITHQAADCFGLSAGRITKGQAANLCLLDPNAQRTPADHWQSAGSNSPWREQALPGAVKLTICQGRVTWGEG